MSTGLPTHGEVAAAAARARGQTKSLRISLLGQARKRSAGLLDAQGREVKRDAVQSKIAHDPFGALYEAGRIVPPPYNPADLVTLRELSTALGQCIDAMATNIDCQGMAFRNVKGVDKIESVTQDEKVRQRDQLQDFFENLNPTMSFTELRKRMRSDIETIGWGALEVRRDLSDGTIAAINHIPAEHIRAGAEYKSPVRMRLWRRDPDSKQWTAKYFMERTRPFAVRHSSGSGEIVWFKQFGDPRSISSVDAKPREGDPAPDYSLPDEAHEVIWFVRYSTGRIPYGVPAWIGNSLGLAGARAAEELNVRSLKNNRIPRIMILTDMELDEQTEEFLEEKFSEVEGPENAFKPILVRAIPSGEEALPPGMMNPGAPAARMLKIEKLTDSIPDDAMFLKYDDAISLKIQRSFRLADIFTGRSSDFNRATAFAATKVTEQQVFAPPRREFDWCLNRQIVPETGVYLCEVESLGPSINDATDAQKIIQAANKAGVGTPNAWSALVQRVTGVDIGMMKGLGGELHVEVLARLIDKGLIAVEEDSEGKPYLVLSEDAKAAADGTAGEGAASDVDLRFREVRSELVNMVRQLRSVQEDVEELQDAEEE